MRTRGGHRIAPATSDRRGSAEPARTCPSPKRRSRARPRCHVSRAATNASCNARSSALRPTRGGRCCTPAIGVRAEGPALDDAEAAQHLASGRALLRLAVQEIAAQRVEIFGHAVDEFARRRRIDHRLAVEDVACVADERAACRRAPRRAGRRRCTSRSRRSSAAERLLGRHVLGRADHVALEQSRVDDRDSSAATPKSSSTTRPSSPTSTLDGLMSR